MVKIEVIQGSQQGRVWEFHKDSIQIGGDPGNDLVIEDIHVSSVHCRLLQRGDVWTIEDMGSTNGTGITRGQERFVLGKAGLASMTVQDGDVLLVGSAEGPVALGFSSGGEVSPGVDDTQVLAAARIQDLMNVHDEVQRDPDLMARLYNVLGGLRWELDLQKVMATCRDAVFEILPGAITFYVGNRRHISNIVYDIHGFLPGTYRAAPTVIRNVVPCRPPAGYAYPTRGVCSCDHAAEKEISKIALPHTIVR